MCPHDFGVVEPPAAIFPEVDYRNQSSAFKHVPIASRGIVVTSGYHSRGVVANARHERITEPRPRSLANHEVIPGSGVRIICAIFACFWRTFPAAIPPRLLPSRAAIVRPFKLARRTSNSRPLLSVN